MQFNQLLTVWTKFWPLLLKICNINVQVILKRNAWTIKYKKYNLRVSFIFESFIGAEMQ